MTKLEAWKAWHESLGIGMEATEHALEKGSHGKAFSYAWDAAVKAEREACAKVCEEMARRHDDIRRAALEVAAEWIRARGNNGQR